ncbi:DUF6415 family natural product biosynthesis protein [Streptomyces sp. NBC_01511]|uniref:DUF6415 family natural product biosynthesis protein n=1 Tax=Streptomyces sp. NBC_01511 TaxID=2903889 RepID=UPI003866C878
MDSRPVDIATMRAAAAELLDDGAEPPTGVYLATLTDQLRGHLELLIFELEEHGCGDPLAKAGIGEARRRLSAGPSSLGPLRYAECLARSVVALCTHTERLTVTG